MSEASGTVQRRLKVGDCTRVISLTVCCGSKIVVTDGYEERWARLPFEPLKKCQRFFM